MPAVDGELLRISSDAMIGDAMIGEATRESHYEVRIEVDPVALDRLTTDVEMTPACRPKCSY